MIAVYTIFGLLLAASVAIVWLTLSQDRHRPSGDRLTDYAYDDDTLTPLPHASLETPRRYEGHVYTAADLPTVQWDRRLPAPKVPVEPTTDETERIVQRVREEANGDG